MDDLTLARSVAQGDARAFEALFSRLNTPMIRYCTGLVRNRARAEDIVQDTWLAVIRAIDGFEGRSSLSGWIYTILTNKAKTQLRRDGRTISFEDDSGNDTLEGAFDGRGRWTTLPQLWETLTPDRIVAGRDILQHVNEVIDALPPAQRSVMVLRCQQDLDSAEVCEILGISEGNMRVLLHRARLAVRKALDDLKAENRETL